MPPIHEYDSWLQRSTDDLEEVDLRRRYIFICEGTSTEVHYFEALVDRWGHLDHHPLVDIRLWERDGDDSGLSEPLRLIQFVQQLKDDPKLGFNRERDRMVIVFDLDIYCRVGKDRIGADERASRFRQVVSAAAEQDILAVTNPSFELFLMLHRCGAYKDIVLPHTTELLENRKIGHKRFAQVLFTHEFGINPKTNSAVGELVTDLEIAIEEEEHLNEDLSLCLETLTCNIGRTIERIQQNGLNLW